MRYRGLEPTIRLLGVSLSPEDEGAKLYKDVIAGAAVAHMVHYGESSFATVFAERLFDTEPAGRLSIRGIKDRLGFRQNSGLPSRDMALSPEDMELVVHDAKLACLLDGKEVGNEMHYLQPMSQDDVRRFTEIG